MDSYAWGETEVEIEGRSGSRSGSMDEEGIALESGHAKDEEQQQNACYA